MKTPWPTVKLGEVLRRSTDTTLPSPNTDYREITVRLLGNGAVLQGITSGASLAGTRRFVARAGQLILSRIDARNGAIALVPDNLDGSLVTNDFPLFNLDRSKLEPAFFGWFSKTAAFVDLCRQASEGTTNRVRLQEDRFLALEIALPLLAEQRRIVARIEELAAKTEETYGLRRETNKTREALCCSIVFDQEAEPSIMTPMCELVKLREPDVVVSPEETYWFAGVYCFGRGVFPGLKKSGAEFAYSHLTRLSTGDFVYPKLMAWEGALGVVPPECNGLVVSPEFPVFEVNQASVLPETLDAYFRTPSVWPTLSATSTGTNVRRRRLNPEDFLKLQIPLPSMATQRTLHEVLDRLRPMKRLQAETVAELDALLPSILDRAFKEEL
ncbi:MAG: restriction endonuclease subunit S [Rubrivivax sp.]|nr:restriction endonuclease subunit S [Rubrivivax sp.]